MKVLDGEEPHLSSCPPAHAGGRAATSDVARVVVHASAVLGARGGQRGGAGRGGMRPAGSGATLSLAHGAAPCVHAWRGAPCVCVHGVAWICYVGSVGCRVNDWGGGGSGPLRQSGRVPGCRTVMAGMHARGLWPAPQTTRSTKPTRKCQARPAKVDRPHAVVRVGALRWGQSSQSPNHPPSRMLGCPLALLAPLHVHWEDDGMPSSTAPRSDRRPRWHSHPASAVQQATGHWHYSTHKYSLKVQLSSAQPLSHSNRNKRPGRGTIRREGVDGGATRAPGQTY